VHDHLAVRLAAEAVLRDQAAEELAIVVDLAVEDEPDRAVFVRKGLAGRLREVDDGQAPVAEANWAVEVHPLGVGPAVGEGARHGSHNRLRSPPSSVEHTADATHRVRITR
jgi:hypothetical protein